MTNEVKPGGPGKRGERADFDLVEDIGDPAAFDRALDELLPKGDLPGGRFDIDPDDFEAFNRELDAQLAQAKARTARDQVVEDLGTDVVERAPAPGPREGAPSPPPVPALSEGPEVADDVVTLGAATAAPATAEPPAPQTVPAMAASPSSAPVAERTGRGAGLAILLGLGGLVAGGVALWMSLEREAELSRLRVTLAEQQAAPAVPAAVVPAGDAEKVRELEGRLEDVNRRLAALSTPAPPAAAAPQIAPAEGPAPQPDPPVAAAAALVKPQGAVPAPEVPRIEPTTPAPEPKPVVVAVAAPPAPEPSPAATSPTPPAASPAPEPSPPATPAVAPAPAAQALPKPSGNGPWAVVIDSFAEEAVADQRRAQVERMSLPAEVRWFLVKDEVRYRVVVPGYSTQDAANTAAAELRRRKAGGAWVMRLQKQE